MPRRKDRVTVAPWDRFEAEIKPKTTTPQMARPARKLQQRELEGQYKFVAVSLNAEGHSYLERLVRYFEEISDPNSVVVKARVVAEALKNLCEKYGC